MRVVLQVIEPYWSVSHTCSLWYWVVSLPWIAQQQLPVALDTPEVLQGAIGIARGHVVGCMTNTEYRLAVLAGFLVKQINSRQASQVLRSPQQRQS